MKKWLVLFACALTAAPLTAGILDSPDHLPGGTDAVVALDLSAGAIPRTFAALSFSQKASEAVLTEQLTGFAADTGIDLTAPFSLVIAGPRAHPEQTLASGRAKVDTAKLLAVLKPMSEKLKTIEIKEVPGGLYLADPKTGLLLKDGTFLIGSRAAVEAKMAGGAGAADTRAVADDLTARAGANAAFAFTIRTPEGLPGQPPPPSMVGGQQLAGFWTRFRSAFAAIREKEFALELVFDSPDAANAALPVVNGWLSIVESQLAAEEARAKAAAVNAGPFKNLDPKWVGARLSVENFKQLRALCTIKTEGPALSFTAPRDVFGGGPSVLVGTAVVGVLAAIAVPNFKAARERANWRACFANQKTIIGATEMYNLDKNKRVTEITPALLEELKTAGYLQSVPNDPGQGEGTAANYIATPGGNGISCKMHGSVDQSTKGQLPYPGTGSSNPMDAGIQSLFSK